MNPVLTIAAEEWRYWARTKLGATAAGLALILICISVFSTLNLQNEEKSTRESLQLTAEETFRNQPARHPHRMVHYGHYVFRTPTPLAALDPGVDPYTGTVMFLEGHRQNSATFSPSYDGAQAGPFARLTPALAYQLLVPLVLIVVGFSVIAREREATVDRLLVASGISPGTVWLGKALALTGLALLLLLPLLAGVVLSGSSTHISLAFVGLYALYLLVWVLMITTVSTWSRNSSAALLTLLTVWTILCILVPRVLASAANVSTATASQIESDMDVLEALRAVGDGHNANDPAFNRLKANLLEKYNVDRVEDLPVNFRGVVAQTAEADLTKIMNEFAEERMANQAQQSEFVKSLQLLSPYVSLQSASMIIAGTDGNTQHRFMREAEAVRFQFVQDLNKVHEEKLSYADDMERNKDEESSKRTRVDPSNWRVLKDFRFTADPAETRFKRVQANYLAIVIWALLLAIIGYIGARRLPEVDHG